MENAKSRFSCSSFWNEKKPLQPDQRFGGMFITKELVEKDDLYPNMDGPAVFRKAVIKFSEVIMEALNKNGYQPSDINMLIPHQANLRIAQHVQHVLKLKDSQVHNNIHKYGNTTAASIPIALCEAWEMGKINEGDHVCRAASGSGFTWASALVKW